MIIEVVGKEIEKIKGDFESYLNGLNMVGEISYSQYSELYDEGTKQIQRAYELGRAELEKENAELIQENEEMKNGLGCETCQIHLEYMSLNNRIADLEKESTELNGKLLEQKQYTEFKCNEAVKKKEIYEREHFFLTNATEIIKELNEGLDKLYLSGLSDKQIAFIEQLQVKAEQFLKDSEVEK